MAKMDELRKKLLKQEEEISLQKVKNELYDISKKLKNTKHMIYNMEGFSNLSLEKKHILLFNTQYAINSVLVALEEINFTPKS